MPIPAQPLENQIAIVTGAGRGIGHAIARALVGAGALVVVAMRTAEAGEAVAAELTAQGPGQCLSKVCDVSVAEDCQKLIESVVVEHGRLDILVNNAGITRDTLLMRMSEEDWLAVLNTNLNSVYRCAKAASRPMLKQRSGRIISITSVVGIMGNAGQCNYAASKAGIVGFSKSLARELGSRGVTVNCIAPGFIETAMTAGLPDEQKKKVVEQIPLARFGTAEDVAQAVLFLAGPGGAYVTGSVLQVDGGMAM